ncbi:MAG: hypothetical protein AABX11_07775 [Nanoarchaeota archaeon]
MAKQVYGLPVVEKKISPTSELRQEVMTWMENWVQRQPDVIWEFSKGDHTISEVCSAIKNRTPFGLSQYRTMAILYDEANPRK